MSLFNFRRKRPATVLPTGAVRYDPAVPLPPPSPEAMGLAGQGSPPAARTLDEALLWFTIVLPAGAEPEYGLHVERLPLIEEWNGAYDVLRFAGPAGGGHWRADVLIDADAEPSPAGAPRDFGAGRSTLIDAGQWGYWAGEYSRMAELYGADRSGPEDRWEWLHRQCDDIRALVDQLAAWLPDGAAKVPGEAFFTEAGRETRRRRPELFTRAQITAARAAARGNLDDVAALRRQQAAEAPPPRMTYWTAAVPGSEVHTLVRRTEVGGAVIDESLLPSNVWQRTTLLGSPGPARLQPVPEEEVSQALARLLVWWGPQRPVRW
ncbi:hypothetical protein AB0F81_39455 [Actinoplanes sp. NPDC024001]|uniref:hypothetical protein n=1 Tax=Actinoplanes sp. NPDC024001 TaxID=3154598 RepID=UPI0033D8850E